MLERLLETLRHYALLATESIVPVEQQGTYDRAEPFDIFSVGMAYATSSYVRMMVAWLLDNGATYEEIGHMFAYGVRLKEEMMKEALYLTTNDEFNTLTDYFYKEVVRRLTIEDRVQRFREKEQAGV